MTEEIIDLIEENATPIVNEMEIEITESIGWAAADTNMHSNLPDRNAPNQHLTSAITGLDEQLAQIKAPRVLYSDKSGVANYYEWTSGAYDEAGYFVSLVSGSSKIKICDGTNIFGVTVEEAGFVGNQGTTGLRGNNYGLVVTSGLVDVRCVSGINEGDYVVANASGLAEKTDSDCGYKVVSKATKDGTEYVSISLGVQACTTNLLGQRVGRLEIDLDAAELNIQAAMKLANDATAMAGASNITSNEAQDKINGVIDATNNALEDVNNSLKDIDTAKQAAKDAAYQAEVVAKQAVDTANGALAKAGELESTVNLIDEWTYTDPVTGITHTGAEYFATYVEDGLSTKASMETVEKLDTENKLLIEKNAESYNQIISSIDKYSVGECSQSYGLTLEQARSILKNGMIYIPTESHKETYRVTIDGKDYSFEKEFTDGFYYMWNSRPFELTVDDGTKDVSGYWWNEKIKGVWHSPIMPQGTAYDFWYDNYTLYKLDGANWTEFEKSVWTGIEAPTTEYDYWFVDNAVKVRSIDEDGAEMWAPYDTVVATEQPTDATCEFWYDGQTFYTHWFEVNTIAGNANSRISSMIRQDVDSIAAEIVNIHGSVAGFDARLTEVEATANIETIWKDPVTGEETMSYIGLKSNDDGSSMSLTVRGKDDTAHETIAGITLEQNDDGSSILIDADKIVIEGESVFKTTEGQTRINGGLIETGSIKSGAIATDALQSLEYSEAEGTTYSDKGTFFNLTDGSIKSTNFAVDAGGLLRAKGANIEGTINAQNGKIGQFTVKDGYMNLMVSGPKNLVLDGDEPREIHTGYSNSEYQLAPNSNIISNQLYTILIDCDFYSSRTERDPDTDFIELYAYSSYDEPICERWALSSTGKNKIVATFYSNKDVQGGEDELLYDISLSSGITGQYEDDYIEILKLKIVEGDHLNDIDIDDAGLVTSDFVGEAMSWAITPEECVWWNQDGDRRQNPLMRLDADGLYVKGEIEATSGVFDNCTINSTCSINGTLEAVSGKIGCLTIDYDNKELYYKSPSGAKEILMNSSGVNIVNGQIGGWAFKEANSSLYGNYPYSSQTVTTTFKPETISLISADESTVNQSTTWARIINICKDSGRLDILETRFLKLLKQADIDINTLDSVVLSE